MSAEEQTDARTSVNYAASDDGSCIILSSAPSTTATSASAQDIADTTLAPGSAQPDDVLNLDNLAVASKVADAKMNLAKCLRPLDIIVRQDTDHYRAKPIKSARHAAYVYQDAVADMQKEHQELVLRIHQQHQDAIAKLQQEHQDALEGLKRKHAVSLVEEQRKHEDCARSRGGVASDDGKTILSAAASSEIAAFSSTQDTSITGSPSVTSGIDDAIKLKDLSVDDVASMSAERWHEYFEESVSTLKASMVLYRGVRRGRAALEEAQQKQQTAEFHQQYQDTIAKMQKEHVKAIDEMQHRHRMDLVQHEQAQQADKAHMTSLEELQLKHTELLELTGHLWRELFETVGQFPYHDISGPEKLQSLFLSEVRNIPRLDCTAASLAEAMSLLDRLFMQNEHLFGSQSPGGGRRCIQALRLRGGPKVNKALNEADRCDDVPARQRWYQVGDSLAKTMVKIDERETAAKSASHKDA